MPRASTGAGRRRGEGPHPVDVHVGSRVRLRRTMLHMSQEKLAAALGVTFQQVQKYERGSNRVSASRLWDMGRVLNAPVSFFFEGIEGAQSPDLPSRELALDRDSARLAQWFRTIPSDDVRQSTLKLITEIAKHSESEDAGQS